MARTVEDAAIVFKAIANKVKAKDMVKVRNDTELLTNSYRIGVLRVPNWVIAANSSKEEIPTREEILRKLGQQGSFVLIDPIEGNQSNLDQITRDSGMYEFNMLIKAYIIINRIDCIPTRIKTSFQFLPEKWRIKS